ncbi:MAG: hypothetical protein JXB39_00975 [Deltaproteobacteria bacterium]|nr:hypothetical protein [Deltaproteobacteria bacterium]
MRTALASFGLLAGLVAGCSPDASALQEAAQAALDHRDFETAIAKSDAGISAAGQDRAATWRLEQIRLEALARAGRSTDVRATFERLVATYAAQVDASLYVTAATWLREAGDTQGAVDLLLVGDTRCPAEHERFQAAITEMSQKQELAPAEVERLRSLGYL